MRQHYPLATPTFPKTLATLLAVGGMALAPLPAISAAQPAAWVKGRILIQPRAGISQEQLDEVMQVHGGHRKHHVPQLNLHVMELPAGVSETAVMNKLRKHRHLKFAELDYLIPVEQTANDTYIGSEWHLTKMQASSAWNVALGDGITVAVLDTGVDATHPDLAGQLVPGWNMFDNNADTTDVYGHGTKVAGVIGASSNNSLGVASLAWHAKIMPVRISDTTGMASISTIASGLTWAADHGAKVANISYAVSGYATVQSAAQYLKNKGGVTVVSAGNSGAVDSSAASDTMISVSATDSSDVITSWSTFGPFVDVSAPGSGIWTTTMGGGYGAVSGTSFSSPATAGTVALMMSANLQLAPTDIEKLLKSTALDLGGAGWDQYYGYGRVNTAAAVLAASTTQAGDSTPPSVAIAAPLNASVVSGIVPVDVNATDNVGVSHVDLLVNGRLVASDTSAPYAFSWDSTKVPDGSSQLVAYAYDAAGNYTLSSTVSVSVRNTIDTTPPSVTISNPLGGSKVSSSVSIKASATDNISVATTRLYIDGVLKTSISGGVLSYSWNTRKVSAGTHNIQVQAVDPSGNTAASSVQVTK